MASLRALWLALQVVVPVAALSLAPGDAAQTCIKPVLTGIDNLLGVCSAQRQVNKCISKIDRGLLTSYKNLIGLGPWRLALESSCSKVRGPGGNLITQDILDDVKLGAATHVATALWNDVFTKCATHGRNCDLAKTLYRPVLKSVQVGLKALIESQNCKGLGLAVTFDESDFVDCGSGVPVRSHKFTEVVQFLRSKLPSSYLAKFPLHDIEGWAEPDLPLPKEADDDFLEVDFDRGVSYTRDDDM